MHAVELQLDHLTLRRLGAASRRGRSSRTAAADDVWTFSEVVAEAVVLYQPSLGDRPAGGLVVDPQGKAIERALPALGFEGVSEVRVGRLVELQAEDPERLAELCERLLANPLIEDYEIELNGK